MQPLTLQALDDGRHAGGMGNRGVRERSSWWLGGIGAVLPVHVVEALGALVVRFERVVVDGPRRGDAVPVLDGLKVFAPQPIEHAAPELRVAADAVVRVGKKLLTLAVEPALGRPVAEVLPHRFRIPVVGLLRHRRAALEHEDPRAAPGERPGHRPAAGAAPDDDDVVVSVHCPMCPPIPSGT